MKSWKHIYLVSIFLLVSISASADGGGSAAGLPGLIMNIKNAAYSALSYLFVIGAAISFVSVGVKLLNGAVQAAPKLVYSGAGFTAGWAVLSAFNSMSATAGTGTVGGSICAALQLGLIVSAMINATKLLIRFMRGTDGESFHKIVMTLVACVVGVAILNVAASSGAFII